MSFLSFLIKINHIHPIYEIPSASKKCVLIIAPHTSMMDFVLGKLIFKEIGIKPIIVIKKELFFFPLGIILRKMGAVPINREHAARFPHFAAELIKNSDEVALTICPEGTRKRVEKWKRGFYLIAQEANVPICLGHLDYRSHTGGIREVFYPTGDYEKDIVEIEKYYYGMRGYHKGHFNLEDKPYAHPEWLDK